MNHSTTALLLIDWQCGFLDDAFWGPRCNPQAEARARELIETWRAAEGQVFHVHHLSKQAGSPLADGSKGAEPQPFATPHPGEPVFTKHVNSGFIGTNLQAELKRAGITHLVISGATTDHCVSTTTRMAANLGFQVQLVDDACFTHDRKSLDGKIISAEQVHDIQLASLNGEFAEVVSTDQVLATLG